MPTAGISLSFQIFLPVFFRRFCQKDIYQPVSLSPSVTLSTLSDVSSLAFEAASHYTMERSGANQCLQSSENYSVKGFICCYFSVDTHL